MTTIINKNATFPNVRLCMLCRKDLDFIMEWMSDAEVTQYFVQDFSAKRHLTMY